MRVTRTVGTQLLALDQDLAGIRRIEPVDEPEELRAAGPDEAAETNDLSRVHLQAHAANLGEPPCLPHLQQDTVGADRPLRIQLLDLAADHELDELAGGRRRRQPCGRGAAVRKDGDAVADAPDLIQSMRDVDDPDTLRSQPANHVEKGLYFALVEDCGGLVHDEQPHVPRQRAGNRDDLLGSRS